MTGDSLHSLDMKGEFELRDGWGGCSSKQELLEQKPWGGGEGQGAFLGMEDDARTQRVWEEHGARKAGGV